MIRIAKEANKIYNFRDASQKSKFSHLNSHSSKISRGPPVSQSDHLRFSAVSVLHQEVFILFISILKSDSRHLASEAKLQTCGEAVAQVTAINFNIKMVLKSLYILNSGH